MSELSSVEIKPCLKSIYLKPFRMAFVENGVERNWDLIEEHDSVVIIIHNVTRNVLVLVKQFRPAVYYSQIPVEERKGKIDCKKYPAALGMSLELCAGIVDKKLPIDQIAKEEVLEETGYATPSEKINLVSTYPAGVGTSCALQTLYYCEVTDDMKVSRGGGVDDECIEVVEMTIPEIMKYVSGENIKSPPFFLFGIYWFLVNKANSEVNSIPSYINAMKVTTKTITKMSKLSSVEFKPCVESKYLKPFRLSFVENGVERNWDLMEVHDGVAIIIHNVTRNFLVLVKQFRPGVYYTQIPVEERKGKIDCIKYPAALGISLEFCAGIVDKRLPIDQIAKEEVLEETGYSVPLEKLEFVSSYASGVSTSSALITLYYCEVTDDMKVARGGGVDNESIEVVEMTIPEIRKYISEERILSPPSFLFGIYWFLAKKAKSEVYFIN